jgi:hypothetical protein
MGGPLNWLSGRAWRPRRRTAAFLVLAAVGTCAAGGSSTSTALGAAVSLDAPTSAATGSEVVVRINGSVTANESGSTLSVLWAPERARCEADPFEEFLADGEYLVQDASLDAGPFSYERAFRPTRPGGYQVCAYIEGYFFEVLVTARATVTATGPAAGVSLDLPASAPAGTEVPVQVSGSVADESGSTLSVLWARERARCAVDPLEEFLNDGQYLLDEAPLRAGAFSFEPVFHLPRPGGYQVCAYIESDFFEVLASARATVNATEPPPPRACPPDIGNALRFAGLSKRIVVGKRERFGLRAVGERSRVEGSVNVRIVGRNGRGKVLFRKTTSRRGSRLFPITLKYRRPPVRVYASYIQSLADGSFCRQEMSRRVRGKNRVYFPSRCYNTATKPRSIIVACGDGNFQLKSLRWKRWNKPRAKARGRAWINDCVPYCAAGTFHSYPARVVLSRPFYCRQKGRYLYRRLKAKTRGRTTSAALGKFACEGF